MCVTCPNLLKMGIQTGTMQSLGRTLIYDSTLKIWQSHEQRVCSHQGCIMPNHVAASQLQIFERIYWYSHGLPYLWLRNKFEKHEYIIDIHITCGCNSLQSIKWQLQNISTWFRYYVVVIAETDCKISKDSRVLLKLYQNTHLRHPVVCIRRWVIIYEFKIWFTFFIYHWCATCNIILVWNLLH